MLLRFTGGVLFLWRGALDSPDLLPSHPITSLSSPITHNRYTDIYSQTLKHVYSYLPHPTVAADALQKEISSIPKKVKLAVAKTKDNLVQEASRQLDPEVRV